MVRLAPDLSTEYIDVAACLSRINQRLYRQGKTYKLNVELWGGAYTGGNVLYVETLPHHWGISAGWKLAKETWDAAHAQELEAGVPKGRWSDFRVNFDSAMETGGAITVPYGMSGLGANGEVLYTQAAFADGTGSKGYRMLEASDANAYGILAEYDNLRNTSTDEPAAAFGNNAPYVELMEELDENQANNLQAYGDAPPYDAVDMVANLHNPQWFMCNGVQTGTTPRDDKLFSGTIEAPLGLLKVRAAHSPQGGDPVEVFAVITVQSGDYKGVAAMDI